MTISFFTRFAMITESGIFYQEAFYTCSQAIREQWFAKALDIGAWALPVCFCLTDKSRIYLIKGEQVITCSKVEHYLIAEKHRMMYFSELQRLKILLKNQRRLRKRIKNRNNRLHV